MAPKETGTGKSRDLNMVSLREDLKHPSASVRMCGQLLPPIGTMPPTSNAKARPASNPDAFAATDQCVLCGLCLPHCPTYGQTGNEADSPRGRISLIQALVRGELPVDEEMTRHLDGCLTCRACEDVCPSGVPYGRLIDNARAELRRRGVRTGLRDFLSGAFTSRRALRQGLYLWLRLARLTGLWRALRFIGIRRVPRLGRLYGLADRLPLAALELDTPVDDAKPAVYLFTGCAAEIFDRDTLRATRHLLETLGYRVLTPPGQTCCGALHQHAGDEETARTLAQTNLEAFDRDIPIVATSSACVATLREYATLLGERGDALGHRVKEACEFLSTAQWPEALALQPLKKRVAIHTPCSQRRVLHSPEAAFELLRRIPQMDLVALPDNARCCGAAGDYMLEHPQMADALVAPKVNAAAELGPDLLATTNIGCAMHLARALAEDGQSVEIVHPATLLARQLAESRTKA